jgi:acid phosphatase family membrane protein YuiD
MYSDKEVLKFFIGLVTLQFIIKLFKNLIKEDRPIKSNTYGMPSSRSAFMFFIVSYLIFTNRLKNTTIFILIIGALLSVYVKFYMKEHSMKQLFFGSCVGIGYSYLISII